jgi:NAD(P)-dependent dehydrogenase (short-subunit alcohol dehydrogenase family)
MTGRIVTVFGGSGFLGRHVVRALCRQGWRVRVACRRPHLAGDVKLAGDVGQVQLIQANVRNRAWVKPRGFLNSVHRLQHSLPWRRGWTEHPLRNAAGAAMSSSPWGWLWQGDADVAAQFGARSSRMPA